jgi:hypothetical protein
VWLGCRVGILGLSKHSLIVLYFPRFCFHVEVRIRIDVVRTTSHAGHRKIKTKTKTKKEHGRRRKRRDLRELPGQCKFNLVPGFIITKINLQMRQKGGLPFPSIHTIHNPHPCPCPVLSNEKTTGVSSHFYNNCLVCKYLRVFGVVLVLVLALSLHGA